MPDSFDPYYTWLGIPPEDQPASHYRLLGLKDFEPNTDVVTNAADQRMAHLRTLQSGKNAAASQQLLNEVSTAARCLLVAEKKVAYDQLLRQQLAAKHSSPVPLPFASAALPTLPTHNPFVTPVVVAEPKPGFSPHLPQQAPGTSSSKYVILAAIVAGAIVASATLVIASLTMGQPNAKNSGVPGPQHPAAQSSQTPPKAPSKVEPAPAVDPPNGNAKTDTVNPFEEVANPFEEIAAPAPPAAPASPQNQSLSPPTVAPSSPAIASTRPDMRPVPAPIPAAFKSAEPSENPFADALATDDASAPTYVRGIQVFDLPTEEQLSAARVQVLEIFGKEAKAAIKPELKVALARKMEKLGRETKDDPAGRFVLLDNVRKLFAGAGEVTAALTASRNLQDWYRFQDKAGQAVQVATFTALSDATLAADQREKLADRLTIEIDAAIEEHDIDLADQCSLLCVKVASRLKEPEKKRAAGQQRTAVTKLKSEFAEYEKAVETLKASPEDTAANLVAGKFLGAVKQDWKAARPHLALTGIAEVRDLIPTDQVAEDDKTAEDAGDLQLAAADAWFDWSQNARGADFELVGLAKVRAKYWYREALGQVTGLNRAKVDKRLKELAEVADVAASRRSKSSVSYETKALAQNYEPGLRGVVVVDGQLKQVMLTYHAGVTVTSAEANLALRDFRGGPQEKVKVIFEGVLVIGRDGDYTVSHAGGSAMQGVHTLFLRGSPLLVVGDNRSKNDSRTLRLAKGEHAIRWELTGGELGSGLIDVQPAGGASADVPLPLLVTSKQVIATLKQRMRREVAFGADPIANKIAGLQPPPGFGPPPRFGSVPPIQSSITDRQPIAPTTTSTNALVNALPGLRGSPFVENAIKLKMLDYAATDNKIIEQSEFASLLDPLRTAGQSARIVFHGWVHITVDGDYTFVHAGDALPGDVNSVFLNERRISRVGENLSPKEVVTLPLLKGLHRVRWEIAGGTFGPARLDIRAPKDAPSDFPQPRVITARAEYDSVKKHMESESSIGRKSARD